LGDLKRENVYSKFHCLRPKVYWGIGKEEKNVKFKGLPKLYKEKVIQMFNTKDVVVVLREQI